MPIIYGRGLKWKIIPRYGCLLQLSFEEDLSSKIFFNADQLFAGSQNGDIFYLSLEDNIPRYKNACQLFADYFMNVYSLIIWKRRLISKKKKKQINFSVLLDMDVFFSYYSEKVSHPKDIKMKNNCSSLVCCTISLIIQKKCSIQSYKNMDICRAVES